MEAGDAEAAAVIFRQIQVEDPENEAAIAGIIRSTLAMGDTVTVKEIVQALPTEIVAKPRENTHWRCAK